MNQPTESNDGWVTLIPQNKGGGARRDPIPRARIGNHHTLYLNNTALKLLGSPARCIIQVNAEKQAIRLTPTADDNMNGWSTATPGQGCRIRSRQIEKLIDGIRGRDLAIKRYPGMLELTLPDNLPE